MQETDPNRLDEPTSLPVSPFGQPPGQPSPRDSR